MDKSNIQRTVWLDNLKSFAIFLLFPAHCLGYLFTEEFNLFIVAFHMPLFVFASGYTSIGLKDRIKKWTDVDKYIKSISLRIALPNLLYTALSMFCGYLFAARWNRVFVFSRRYNWFSRYGSLTLALYPLNCIYVVIFNHILHVNEYYSQDTSYWWLVIIYMFVVLLSALITVELFNKYRFTRFCFLGSK